jgi:glycosyltransferase involved in cell wall biosynthesis
MELKPHLRIVIASLEMGGSEKVCLSLANLWSEEGKRIELLLVRKSGAFLRHLHPSVAVRASNSRRARNSIYWFVSEINRYPEVPVLVFGFSLGVMLAPLRWTGVLHAPIIYREGSAPEKNIPSSQHWLYRYAIACLDAHIAQTDQAARALVRLGISQRQLAVIANPVSPTGSVSADFQDNSSRDIKLGPRLLVVGRLSPEKGHARLIEAFSYVHKKYSSSTLQIAGDGPLRAALEARVQELRLGDAVSLLGSVANSEVLSKGADIFVLPSFYEGQPNALIEALLAGCRILGAGGCGVKELLVQGGLCECYLEDSDFGENFVSKLESALSIPGSRWQLASQIWRGITSPQTVSRKYWNLVSQSTNSFDRSVY